MHEIAPIFQTICRLFAQEDILFGNNPKDSFRKLRTGESIVGHVRNTEARKFFAFAQEIQAHIKTISIEHANAHRRAEFFSKDDCLNHLNRVIHFEYAFEAVTQIFWEFVFRDFPTIERTELLYVCENWDISSPVKMNGLCNHKERASNFLSILSEICKGKSDFKFEPVLHEKKENEVVVGVLFDPIVCKLKMLCDKINPPNSFVKSDEEHRQLANTDLAGDIVDFSAKMKPEEVRAEILRKLFFRGVVELFPQISTSKKIAVRSGWKIVVDQSPEEETAIPDHIKSILN